MPTHLDSDVVPYDDKNEKNATVTTAVVGPAVAEDDVAKNDLELVSADLEDLEAKANVMSTERARHIIAKLYKIHQHDQNFPRTALDRMQEFLARPEHETQELAKANSHDELLKEMKLEAVLATDNSPYLEVRANVDPTDDPTLPSLTFRVLILGTLLSGLGSFVDTLFANRLPSVFISANVAQLIAYPCGKFMQRVLPTKKFTTFGKEWSFNPGRFNAKEHMLIAIMANVSFSSGYTNSIIPTQAMPFFFNMQFARSFGYQFLNTVGFTFVGYGLAGLTRRFLVYPSVAIWPSAFAQIALNRSFHTEKNEPVKGPFGIWRISREKFFLVTFIMMFVYFWFPGYLFQALSYFSWMTWISPNNVNLAAITSFAGGMGLNPWPTFDWNVPNANGTIPLTLPTFTIMNQFIGVLLAAIVSIAFWYSNAWNTGYLPINSNKTWSNAATRYNVSKILDVHSDFDNAKYQQYSEPWMGAAYIVCFILYFAMYSATLVYVILYHRHDIAMGWKSLKKTFRNPFRKNRHTVAVDEDDDLFFEDVHMRLMRVYPEVPEWQYLIVLLIAMACGMIGLGIYPTDVSPATVLFGVIMPLIVIVPCGLIQAITGMPIPLNVLAEFIGGAIKPGSANSLIYFKTYGYIAAYQALAFSSDLKLAHYLKIPPRHTFAMQVWATVIYCFICAGLQNYILGFKDVCTSAAKFGMSCPGANTFFTSAVFWGTLGPVRLFGPGKRYTLMLLGFPIGLVAVLAYWALRKAFPRKEWIRQLHPVMIFNGGAYWGPPLNMSYFIGNVYITVFSFQFIRKRYTAFWAKYNYVLAASFPAGIAIAALVIFFGTAIPKDGQYATIAWWGNDVLGVGCEGGGCPRLTLAKGEVFGAPVGSGKFT
ncbi:hypothetical protein CspHIS471_0510240 [Cutaneotrichosporon sp. HIS471]|nr:hypothetical protein CspHIS471_0510240 [Cutaneotrichosporon sp. HIS471]